MSVVVGHVSGIIASDSACESDDTMFTVDDKIVCSNGTLIGLVGGNYPTSRIYRAIDSQQSMGSPGPNYINSIVKANTDPGQADFSCLVVWPKHGIWLIDAHDSICEVKDDFFAIGAGGPVALGAMHAMMALGLGTLDRAVERAVHAACAYTASCRLPYRMLKL